MADINLGTRYNVTDPLSYGIFDSNPIISKKDKNTLYFLSNRNGLNQIWMVKFNGTNINKPTQYTNF